MSADALETPGQRRAPAMSREIVTRRGEVTAFLAFPESIGLGVQYRQAKLGPARSAVDDPAGALTAGSRLGTVLISLAVDRSLDQVWVDFDSDLREASIDQLDGLEMAIRALTDAKTRLAGLYDDQGRRRTRGCVGIDSDGYRCSHPSRHGGEHDFNAKKLDFKEESA